MKRAREVRTETEAEDKLKKVCARKSMPQHGGFAFLWASVWVLREIEVRNMKIRDATWNDEVEKRVTIRLPQSKSDQQAIGVKRTLAFCGESRCSPTCPVNLARPKW